MPFPVAVEYVRKTEAMLGRKLPPGYVIRLCRENGGEVLTDGDVWQLHPIFDDSDRTRLKRTCNDLVRETVVARKWPDFPPEAVAIGENGGGDRLILLPADEGRYGDVVYWWDHETGEIHQVADDFADLIDHGPASR